MASQRAEIGIVGGSGFYTLFDDASHDTTSVELATPFGAPSADVTLGSISGRSVAFLPRHGVNHQYAPHLVPARANLWALRNLGVRQVIAPCAVGSLRADMHPGDIVVLDQLVDRTKGRPDTFQESGTPRHVSFADPYSAELGRLAVEAAERIGERIHASGTVVVVQGPRFSTRAESKWFRDMGWDVVNMTQYPEAYLAREIGLHYAGIGLVTDYDTGLDADPSIEPVTQEEVFARFDHGIEQLRALFAELVPTLSTDPPDFPDALPLDSWALPQGSTNPEQPRR